MKQLLYVAAAVLSAGAGVFVFGLVRDLGDAYVDAPMNPYLMLGGAAGLLAFGVGMGVAGWVLK